jgi:ElaB/YqjD/DUF883 family membrane-anchored ribosome-binding protein
MAEEVSMDQLVADLQTVIRDAESLLKATAAQTGEKIEEARGRAEESVRKAKVRLAEVERDALEHAQELAGEAEAYVRANPWQAIGWAAGAGVVLGLLLGRR